MSDIHIKWNVQQGRGEWATNYDPLLGADDLVSAVFVSLFTDRVANPDDVIPDGTDDRRGCWTDTPTQPIGSRLWLLNRAKQTDETKARAFAYIAEALQWLIDDKVVARFGITVEWTRASLLGAQITAYRFDGTKQPMNFAWAWTGL
jgi:phage gp46-like protein